MGQVNGISGYQQIPAVQQTQNRSSDGAKTPPSVSSKPDSVEISPTAQLLGKISTFPEIRQEKVEEIRAQLANGTYDIDGKLPEAIDSFLDDYEW